jgi:hypothetical protein
MSSDNNNIIADLRNCTVGAAHRRVDWSEILGEDLEGWEAFEVVEWQDCNRELVVSSRMGCDQHRYIEPEFTVINEDGDEEEVENYCLGEMDHEVGPQMNFFYPAPIEDAEEAAFAIAHLPLCVVVMEDGEAGFALTGGGMDLSWEICAAYIACGFLPPLEYCDLPDMAGRGRQSDTALVLAACARSCEIAEGWAARKRERLARLAQGYEVKLPE